MTNTASRARRSRQVAQKEFITSKVSGKKPKSINFKKRRYRFSALSEEKNFRTPKCAMEDLF